MLVVKCETFSYATTFPFSSHSRLVLCVTALRVRYQFGLHKVMALSISFNMQQKMAREKPCRSGTNIIYLSYPIGAGNFKRATDKTRGVCNEVGDTSGNLRSQLSNKS